MSNQFQRLNDFDKPIFDSDSTASGKMPDKVVEAKPVESKPNVEPKLIILPTGSSSGPKFTCLVVSRPVPPPKKKVITPNHFILWGLLVYGGYQIYKLLERTNPNKPKDDDNE